MNWNGADLTGQEIWFGTSDPTPQGLAGLRIVAENAAQVAIGCSNDNATDAKISRIKGTINPEVDVPTRSIMGGSNAIENDPRKGLVPFCQMYSGGFLPHQALTLIKEGQDVLRGILDQSMPFPSKNSEEGGREVAALTWKFMKMALIKNQGYQEGTFIIEDSEGKFFDYLAHGSSYERISSHYKGRGFQYHYGVDIKNGLMPAGKTTILFSQVPQYSTDGSYKSFLFMKPENYGTNDWSDKISHVAEYAKSVAVKVLGQGGDDLPSMSKERVPVVTAKAFEAFVEEVKKLHLFPEIDSESNLDEVINQAKIWGIAYMRDFIKKVSETTKPLQESADDGFLSELARLRLGFDETINSFDHLDKRTGREVYFSEAELNEAAYT